MTDSTANSLLMKKIQAIERGHVRRDAEGPQTREVFSTGWNKVDQALGGGLPTGGLHEWFGLAPSSQKLSRDQKPWRPPLCVVIHLAWRVLDNDGAGRWAVWIGRRCFPYPAALLRKEGVDRILLRRSLFVAPRNATDRLWAIDLALRSPAVGVVIGDGSGFDMAATRRIQLVAKNHAVPAFLVRPPWEQSEPSAAHSRWLVRNEAVDIHTEIQNPAWNLELLRCKGVHWEPALTRWRVEWNHAECTLNLSAPVADPAGTAYANSAIIKHGERLHRLRA